MDFYGREELLIDLDSLLGKAFSFACYLPWKAENRQEHIDRKVRRIVQCAFYQDRGRAPRCGYE